MSWKTVDIKGRNLSIKEFKNLGKHSFELNYKNKLWKNPVSFVGLTMFDFNGFKSIKTSAFNIGNKVNINSISLNYISQNITSTSQKLIDCNFYHISGTVWFISQNVRDTPRIELYENNILQASNNKNDGVDTINEGNILIDSEFSGYYQFSYRINYDRILNSNKDIDYKLKIISRSHPDNAGIRDISGYYNTSEINTVKPINHMVITLDI